MSHFLNYGLLYAYHNKNAGSFKYAGIYIEVKAMAISILKLSFHCCFNCRGIRTLQANLFDNLSEKKSDFWLRDQYCLKSTL